MTEAIERLVHGAQMKRIGELLTVSVLGLCVNLVGMMAFDHAHHGHGHGHSHGGQKHDHSHGTHQHDHHHHHHSPGGLPSASPSCVDSHSHSHSHSHGHGNDNMRGIFLHVLADTLGSVAVVISTLLIHFYSWPGFDPLASCIIAILIFASAIPLVLSSAKTLLLTIPADTEYTLRETLIGVSSLRGVSSYRVPKFWLDDREYDYTSQHNHDHHHHDDHHQDHHHHHDGASDGTSRGHIVSDGTENGDGGGEVGIGAGARKGGVDIFPPPPPPPPSFQSNKVLGVIHVIANRGTESEEVRQRVVEYLHARNVDAVVQVEREGESRCWCASTGTPMGGGGGIGSGIVSGPSTGGLATGFKGL